MHAMKMSNRAIDGITIAYNHFIDLFLDPASKGASEDLGGVIGGFIAGAGAGALVGLNAENEPLPVEGTGTVGGRGAFAGEGAARLLS
jgi:hypothetical protein